MIQISKIFFRKNKQKTKVVDPYDLRLFVYFYKKDEADLDYEYLRA